MANLDVSQLTAITATEIDRANDLLYFWDNSLAGINRSKKVSPNELIKIFSIASSESSKASNYTIVQADDKSMIQGNATAGTLTLTLPDSATVGPTFSILVRKSDSSLNIVIIQRAGTDTIDGTTLVYLAVPGEAVLITNNGAGAFNVALRNTCHNGYLGSQLSFTDSGTITNLSIGQDSACHLRWVGTSSTKIVGIAEAIHCKTIVIYNDTTNFLLWLENENTSATAPRRLKLPNAFPFFLMPGDRVWLMYNAIDQRWGLLSSSATAEMGLTQFSDFIAGAPAANGGCVNGFGVMVNGTGASCQGSTYLANTTERPLGLIQIDTGTVATGRATIGGVGTADIIPTLGPALSVARLAVETAVTSTETFAVSSGFIDVGAAGATTDGVCWEYRWNGSAAEWSQSRFAATVASRTTTGSPAVSTNYIWLVVFVNPTWTRADFIFSNDSVSFTIASSPTTGFPSSAQPTTWTAGSIVKSVGTTQRNLSLDLAGYRVDYVRG